MASTSRRTQAWVLPARNGEHEPGLELREIEAPAPGPSDVLADPLWGSWEANMTHALRRSPLDVCAKRGEPFVVLGNSGIARVVECGRLVRTVREGDIALVLGHAHLDPGGFSNRIYGYDAPGTIGLLARRTVLHETQVARLPEQTRHRLEQWAAFGVRFLTAWDNWRVARRCWDAVAPASRSRPPDVCAWGGGVSFAELQLAMRDGSRAAMVASSDSRLRRLTDAGIAAIDRREIDQPACDDPACASRLTAEPQRGNGSSRSSRDAAQDRVFLDRVRAAFDGKLADIFIDNIGGPAWPRTLRALGRPGVVATCGWKHGADLTFSRPMACFQWHVHVHTHYVSRATVEEAVAFAEEHGWLPTLEDEPVPWHDIPRLAAAYDAGLCDSYFPTFEVNGMSA